LSRCSFEVRAGRIGVPTGLRKSRPDGRNPPRQTCRGETVCHRSFEDDRELPRCVQTPQRLAGASARQLQRCTSTVEPNHGWPALASVVTLAGSSVSDTVADKLKQPRNTFPGFPGWNQGGPIHTPKKPPERGCYREKGEKV
jgi:hypothetical protein